MIIVRDGIVVNRVVGELPPGALGPEEMAYQDDAPIGSIRQADGSYLTPETALDLVAYAAAQRKAILESHRLAVGPFTVPTDETTRNVLTAAYVKASANHNYQIADWKVGPAQYVALDSATIIAVADAVEAFVQVMFARNRIADEAIEAGTATTAAQVDAILAG